jgi:endonuclease/exonuclease/phosphatase family metal-dependent hydrolase
MPRWVSIERSLGVAAILAALATAGACASIARHDPSVRVLVFNIHAGKDAGGRPNLEDVANLVRSTSADIVLLQEVDRGTNRSGKVDQLQVLSEETEYESAFGQSLEYDGGQYGIAALARKRFYFSRTVPLHVVPVQTRAGGSREPRVALLVVTPTRMGSLQLVNAHLDASQEEAYRLQELNPLLNIVRARLSPSTPVLLGGDLNAEPGSEVHKQILAAGLRDAWTECGQGDGFTYPADNPVKRIDYLFLTGPLGCRSARVIETNISDHRPLLVNVVRKPNSENP